MVLFELSHHKIGNQKRNLNIGNSQFMDFGRIKLFMQSVEAHTGIIYQ